MGGGCCSWVWQRVAPAACADHRRLRHGQAATVLMDIWSLSVACAATSRHPPRFPKKKKFVISRHTSPFLNMRWVL
jgi:hypothetical protein